MIVIVGQIVCFVALLFAVHNAVAIAIMLFLTSAFGFGFSTPIQVRVLKGAEEAPRLAATLVSTAYNVGIAAGAAVGAALLTAGVGYALLPATGIVCSGIALVTASISLSLSRKAAA
jgi:DHA1 family inner membrane transport protein